MVATLQELEKRVDALENEARELRALHVKGSRVEVNQSWADAWTRLQQELGIKGQPIGAEKLQEMIAGCGFTPEENAFSREIIAMREE